MAGKPEDEADAARVDDAVVEETCRDSVRVFFFPAIVAIARALTVLLVTVDRNAAANVF